MTPRTPSGAHEPALSLTSRVIETPVGALLVVASRLGIRAVAFTATAPDLSALRASLGHKLGAPVLDEDAPLLARAERAMAQYFSGRSHAFQLPLDVDGTSFQRRVWRAVAAVPPGTTVTYGELATELGRSEAVRAVANACARNPVPLLVPCHRVVGADGDLRGYLGGLDAKRRLLALERRFAPDLPLLALVSGEADAPAEGPEADGALAPAPTGEAADEDEWLTRVLDREAVEEWPALAEEALGRGLERAADELIEAWTSEHGELLTAAEESLEPSAAGVVAPQLAVWAPRAPDEPSWPPVGAVAAFVRVAARLGSPALARTGRALARARHLPAEHRRALAGCYVAIMSGETTAPRHIRELAVDLWLELDPERHEAALRGLLEDPSASIE